MPTLDLDLDRLLAYEFWADREALAALRRAGDAAPPRALQITNHIIAAAQLWLTRMTGENVKVEVWPSLSMNEMSARIDELEQAWRTWASDAMASKLDGPIAYVNSLGESWTNSVRDILTHMVVHAAYHRGQIATLLGQAGCTPAYTDYIHASRRRFI